MRKTNKLVAAVTGKFGDPLVDAMLDCIRRKKVPAYERHAALQRAGAIASAYVGASDDLIESVFGATVNSRAYAPR
jgi:hypothetical protein